MVESTALPNGDTITLRELYARLEGFIVLMNERDRHYRELMANAEEAVEKAFHASEKAIEKADAARTVHDAAVNEWRAQYNAQEMKFLPKAEYDSKMRDLGIEIARIAGDQQRFPTKTEVEGKFIVQDARFDANEKRTATLEKTNAEELGRRAQSVGDKGQSNVQVGWVFAGFGLITSVISIGIGLVLALTAS